MSAKEFRDTFRGSPIRRTKRAGLRRNVMIAMGNSGEKKFLPLLERLAADEDEVVAESEGWGDRKRATSRSSRKSKLSQKERDLRHLRIGIALVTCP